MGTHRLRYSLYGVGFVVVLVLTVIVSIAQFNRAFTSTDTLYVSAPRAGLLLDTSSAVKLRGVTVGHVTAVSATDNGAVINLAITPEDLHLIPADAGARIVPPTLFGGKYVELLPSATTNPAAISSGAHIEASSVTVEVNDTFAHLMQLLNAAQPAKVSAALTALATALQGRGNEVGQLLQQVDTYLQDINPSLPQLDRDLTLARSVLSTYAQATPDLLGTASNMSTTGDSIQANRASLDAFLLSLVTGSDRTATFLKQNRQHLTTALDVLAPATQVLAEYAPEFPCFFQGLANALPLAEAAVGGKQPGLGVLSQFLPPEKPYVPVKDLPKIGADIGPKCYGMPSIPMGTQIPHQIFNVGTDPYASDSPTGGFTIPTLLQLLFGPIKGGVP